MSDKLLKCGFTEKQIQHIPQETCESLEEFISSRSIQQLTIAQKSSLIELYVSTKSKHREFVADYIIQNRLNRENLSEALRYLKLTDTMALASRYLKLTDNVAFDNKKFEEDCGIDIVISNDEIVSAIREIYDPSEQFMDWASYQIVLKKLQDHKRIRWANRKELKDQLDVYYIETFGPKPIKQKVESTQESINPNEYHKLRIKQMANLKDQGYNPYPHKFHKTITLANFRREYDYLTADQRSNESVNICGRILHIRIYSKKLVFIRITEEDTDLQIMANYSEYENTNEWQTIISNLRIGDIIGTIGHPLRSKTNDLSIIPKTLILLAPCLHMIPHKLDDKETRYRQRYLDMMVNPQIIQTFKLRSKIITFVRNYFTNKDFIEVETPMMMPIPGGASAKPFVTHHNELKSDLFLRIAPELHLKQLLVGGMSKIFEIGKNYRNEGIDQTHNPEFTAIEAYEAFADCGDIMNTIEDLFSKLVYFIHGKYQIEYQSYTLDFTPPFKRVSLIPTLERKLQVIFPEDLGSEETNKWLQELCAKHDCECSLKTNNKLIDTLCDNFIESEIIYPTFITDFPQITCPLAKYHRNNPQLTERFDLFVAGKEIAGGYTELNDPEIQRKLFQLQVVQNKGDEEAQLPNEEYCVSLEYGLPPCGGLGIGLDRLVMMLTNNINIKDVLLFPMVKSID